MSPTMEQTSTSLSEVSVILEAEKGKLKDIKESIERCEKLHKQTADCLLNLPVKVGRVCE